MTGRIGPVTVVGAVANTHAEVFRNDRADADDYAGPTVLVARGRSGAVTSQAESASSLLITRSTTKAAQVMDPGLLVVRCDHSPPSEPVSAP
ncbi:hypothetical protein SALBM311S_09521 [Streptomyces alboniger]